MRFLLFLCALSLSSCSLAQRSQIKTFSINPYLEMQHYEHFKRLVLSAPDEAGPDYIQGFDFEWGYHYKLRVEVIALEQILSDGTRFDYRLKKVVEKKPVAAGTRFSLVIDANRYYHEVEEADLAETSTLKANADGTYTYFDELTIEVTAAFEKDWKAIVEGKKQRSATLLFVGPNRVRLEALK